MMDALDRRSFLKVAGAGSASAAGIAAFPLMSRLGETSGGLSFRAVAGLPEAPLPSYATHIVEGRVDLSKGSGLVTSRVLAGHPGEPSSVGLPGLARMIHVTDVDAHDHRVRLRGVIEDRSQLRRGESSTVEVLVDHKRGVVHAPFLGRQTELKLARF
jgi:hypothetical protein